MRSTTPLDAKARRRRRRGAPALLLCLSLVFVAPAAGAPPVPADDARVITTWNAVAASTVPANPAAFLNYAFVHLAMYNAVVGITGEYAPYQWSSPAPRHASPEAAAAAAAHRVLVTYFPASQANLDAQLAASLALIPDGGPQDKGIGYGLRAADHIIALRANDGRGAAVSVPPAVDPGDYIGGFAVPWLGLVTPLALDSLSQLDPGPPPALDSPEYLADLAEVRTLGDKNLPLTDERAAQIATASYFAALPFAPMQEGLRGVAAVMDISESARFFAAMNTVIADALGTAWKAKLAYPFWRPVQAINYEIGIGGPAWVPLLTTPPYPEWPSGLCSVIGAMTAGLEHLTGGVSITMGTQAAGYRSWSDKTTLDGTAVDARVWSGIHYRSSDEVGIAIGDQAASHILSRYFAPTD
jgi:hypothetical protein